MVLTVGGLIWLIMGVICFVLEMVLPGFIMFFFGVGAWVTALACWLTPIDLNEQLGLFLVTSLFSLFALRRFLKNKFFNEEKKADGGDNVSVVIGDPVLVLEDIGPNVEGRIRYSGSQWRAIADEHIPAGTTVSIVEQHGSVIKVTRVKD